ncbi:hypothetical protein GLYMA_06G114433v4 [Glycine max]|nr:hypothetical protein GLYMA_06G114433v4 [Glycine max]KAH1125368.1 hypothetical protein GYH30_014788 [Glycine max]
MFHLKICLMLCFVIKLKRFFLLLVHSTVGHLSNRERSIGARLRSFVIVAPN